MQRTKLGTIGLAVLGATVLASADAHAQQGTTQKPMPNVLLLVDTSGSMERMPNNTLPSENSGVLAGRPPNACSPGVESTPNRWGMLLQALTGNMQPFYSCAEVNRSQAAFKNEYKIANANPYDTDYVLPYHRPLTGDKTDACAIGPYRLPGAASGTTGVGPGRLGYASPAGQGGDVRDFPDDALVSAKYTYMQAQYGTGTGSALASPLSATNSCVFEQTPDGQLDAARDYVRFALMTFDNDPSNAIGVNDGTWPPQGAVQTGGTTQPFLPFAGQWSYRRDSSNPDYNSSFSVSGSSYGLPSGCTTPKQLFELGARHWGAPPWEGRMVQFPAQDATLADIQRTNEQIQRVLLTSRPYGATPIDGMMDDARDYFWYKNGGPVADGYVGANCRDQYIILLTDGAPNLNMRPSCEGPTGTCPFPRTSAQTAEALWMTPGQRVTTFVIGFSVNGDSSVGTGFPAPYDASGQNNCKSWYTGLGGTPTAMANACSANPPPTGSTAEACCLLNEIAYRGSGGASAPTAAPAVGPFFAESQADIVLSFGKILAAITKSVSTRTVPTYTPAAYKASTFAGQAMSAQFMGSFIPNAQKPWSGEILRERSECKGTPLTASPRLLSASEGDSMSINLARQGAARRLFITAVADSVGTGTKIDSAGTIRPFLATTTDGIPVYSAEEFADKDYGLRTVANMPAAMDITRTTCKRGRSDKGPHIPALDDLSTGAQDCTDVVMGFATGHAAPITKTGSIPGGSGSYNFNIRCTGLSPSTGHCSVSNATCDTAAPSACDPIPGQVCVPDCAPLGAVFRANPIITGPPDALLRDNGYRDFQGYRRNRAPALFAATTDGLLHAFKAMEQDVAGEHELWSFIPPAVLPRLATNYPSGNQILLDGTPVARDTVWERGVTDLETSGTGTTPGAKWHTTLVAGLGQEGSGYYAVNITDSNCAQTEDPASASNDCIANYQKPTKGSLEAAGGGDYKNGTTQARRGPHFLWQLTDVKSTATETARVTRRGPDGVNRYALFGRRSGTPAITTVQIGDKQIGVAILPGGVDGSPVQGGSCAFSVLSTDSLHDVTPRGSVRKWANDCYGLGPQDAVPGRGVAVVRLDTGEIIRYFGREHDVPTAIWTNRGIPSPFHSPVIGTPVVYPQTIGAVAQKVYVGDADGMLWRIDLTSNNSANWKVQLAADVIAPITGAGAAESQPIQIAPVISLDSSGALVVNVATGDQESVVYKSAEKNIVVSLAENRDVTTNKIALRWYEVLDDGERVTGPMTVFDRTLFFASFQPRKPSEMISQCTNAGVAKLWGLNYAVAENPTSPGGGGQPMWCETVQTNGLCGSEVKKNNPVPPAFQGSIIPGVVLRPTLACAQFGDVGESVGTGFTSIAPSDFVLAYGVPQARNPNSGSGLPPSVTTNTSKRPLPRISTSVNAWALVVD
jgi:type IV pilus assembly protein PilY1